MNILCVDTSGVSAGVAMLRAGKLCYEAQLTHGRTHSQCIMPMVDDGMSQLNLSPTDIDLYAAVVGPGSFTGVRIGVSTIKAMAHAAGKPCIGIDALEALAAGIHVFDGVICPIFDARAQQVYGAAFEAGLSPKRIMDDVAMKLEDYLAQIKAMKRAALFIGDGAKAFAREIGEAMGESAHFAPQHLNGVRAASAAMLAMEYKAGAGDYLSLEPLYLRAPQAERERLAREAASHA